MDARGIRVLPQKKEGTPMRKVTAQRLAEFTERDYVLTFGVGKREFDRMLAALEDAYRREHKRKPRFNSSAFNKAMLYDTFNWYEVNDHDITDNLGVDFSTLIKNLEKGDL